MTTPTKCGYVAILGEPNVGKSTLLNQLVGAKVSIVCHKVQTTRRRLLGIIMEDQTQIVFVDTPGIFEPKKALERAMVKTAWQAAQDTDVVVVLVDASKKNQEGTEKLIDKALQLSLPVVLVINKVDKVQRADLLPLVERLTQGREFAKVFMISATTGSGVQDLAPYFSTLLPSSPWHYDPEQITDLPLRQLAAEITREKIMHLVHQEIPYQLTVETEHYENFDNGDVKINQLILVAREGHKGILLGKKGELIKRIREAAQIDISQLLEARVHLFLQIRVEPNWLDKNEHWQEMGLERDR
ncbi:MAG: GTPase Era [Holosporales bacterium]